MPLFIVFLRNIVLAALDVLDILFLASVICSFVDPERSGRFSSFIAAVTEPIIFPLRALFGRFGWFENFPVDMPFFFTWILLGVLQTVLLTL